MEGVGPLLERAKSAGLKLSVKGAGLIIEGSPAAEAIALELLASKQQVWLALLPESDVIPACCPVCRSELHWLDNEHFTLYACSREDADHFIAKKKKKQLIPEPMVGFNRVERCFNGNCPGLLEFKDGRATCRRCDTDQRVVS